MPNEERKKRRAEKKESRAHDRSARKTFRGDHSLGWRLKHGVKKLFQGNKNR